MYLKLPSLIAIIPMLVHGILGCCWHHGHLGVDADRVGHSVCQSSVDEDSHHHHHVAANSRVSEECGHKAHDGDVPSEPAPEPHSPCEDEPCDLAFVAMTVPPPMVDVEDLATGLAGSIGERDFAGVVSTHSRSEEDRPQRLVSSAQRRAQAQVWLL